MIEKKKKQKESINLIMGVLTNSFNYWLHIYWNWDHDPTVPLNDGQTICRSHLKSQISNLKFQIILIIIIVIVIRIQKKILRLNEILRGQESISWDWPSVE